MPFENHASRPFTFHSIERNAPTQSGVYGISNADQWLYIGETDDIRGQLLGHLGDLATFMTAQHPTGFTYELCAPADRRKRQEQLIAELEPALNRRAARGSR